MKNSINSNQTNAATAQAILDAAKTAQASNEANEAKNNANKNAGNGR